MARAFFIALLTVCVLPTAASAFTLDDYPLAERAGVIQELDPDSQALVIDGVRYGIAVDAQVEIGGSYGAVTMLQPGMRVYFEYRRISSSERVITLLRELPEEVELEPV